jgi:large repetitive protein
MAIKNTKKSDIELNTKSSHSGEVAHHEMAQNGAHKKAIEPERVDVKSGDYYQTPDKEHADNKPPHADKDEHEHEGNKPHHGGKDEHEHDDGHNCGEHDNHDDHGDHDDDDHEDCNVNIAPVAVADNLTGNEDRPLVVAAATLLANDTDANGDTLSIISVQGALHGTVVLVNGVVTFTPDPNYNGPAEFTYTISDGKGGFDTAKVNLIIEAVNDAPVDDDETNTVIEDTTLNVAAAAGLLANNIDIDIDGDTASITSFVVAGNTVPVSATSPGVATLAEIGVLTINSDGSYSFAPAANYTDAIPEVIYTVSDGQGGSDTSKLTLTIDPRNDAPDAVDDGEFDAGAISGNQDTVITIDPATLMLANDTDVDGDTLVVLSVQGAVNGNAVFENGVVTFTPKAGYFGPASFTYTISDGHGGTDTATFFIDIILAPALEVAPLSFTNVSEESLLGGISDAIGMPDTTDASTSNGNIVILNAAGALTVSLAAPTEALTSGGVAVTWLGAGTSQLTAMAGANMVATVAIDNTGHYTVNLLKPIDHNGVGEDVKTLNFAVNVTDGTSSASGVLAVAVEDDAPVAISQENTLAAIDTNLLITLDVSNSMNDPSGINGQTKFQSSVASIKQLLNTYDAFGEVSVRLVTFADGAVTQGTTWATIAQTNSLLDSLIANGNSTNYDGALANAIKAFADPGKITGAQNVSYFFSDGDPNRGDGNADALNNLGSTIVDAGINANEETIWTSFLNNNQIKSYAIGIGSAITKVGFLDPIAHDGQAQLNIGATIVQQLSDLNSVLAGTVTDLATGQLLTGQLTGTGVGGDGGFISAVTVEDATYLYDPVTGTIINLDAQAQFDAATKQLTLNLTSGGHFVIDMDNGDYQYFAPLNVSSALTQRFDYVITDNDGDKVSASVILNVENANVIIGTLANDTLTGTAGTDKILSLAGDDLIQSGAGNDIILAGDGNDTLVGGAGDDALTGGLGADTFVWSLADASAAGVAADKIIDFNPVAVSAGGDALDLRDLLSGENAGNLTSYLHFEKTGVDTVLHLSSNGGYAAGFNAANDAQIITLTAVDLVAGFANDQAIITDLLAKQKLITD